MLTNDITNNMVPANHVKNDNYKFLHVMSLVRISCQRLNDVVTCFR